MVSYIPTNPISFSWLCWMQHCHCNFYSFINNVIDYPDVCEDNDQAIELSTIIIRLSSMSCAIFHGHQIGDPWCRVMALGAALCKWTQCASTGPLLWFLSVLKKFSQSNLNKHTKKLISVELKPLFSFFLKRKKSIKRFGKGMTCTLIKSYTNRGWYTASSQ